VSELVEFLVRLNFHASLRFFLREKSHQSLGKTLREKTSVKDVIESCGVPHPEVDLILIDGSPVNLAFLLDHEHGVEIFGVPDAPEHFEDSRLQKRNINRFVADGHLGKLARFLRLLGVDVAYERDVDDRKLIEVSITEERALLTRDRRLLMHAVVRDGYYPRSQNPEEQTVEVVRRFQLGDTLTPYTRCLHCNAALNPVRKDEIFSQLEPLTKVYYDDFHRCGSCGKIYWAGSHFPKLQARIATLRKQLQISQVGD
jgi:uncharacterized protein with PIN domain